MKNSKQNKSNNNDYSFTLNIYENEEISNRIYKLNNSNYSFDKENEKKLINFITENIPADKKIVFCIHQFELGDAIILNGLYRYLLTKYDYVIIAVRNDYYNQIKIMYFDEKNILFYILEKNSYLFNYYNNIRTLIPYTNNIMELFKNYNITFKPMGNLTMKYFDSKIDFYSSNYPEFLYKNHGYNIKAIQYNFFKINRNLEMEDLLYNKLISIIGENYIIVIDDEKRKFTISNLYLKEEIPIFKIGLGSINNNKDLESVKDENIFNYLKILENAKEVHSIHSSIVLLIEHLKLDIKCFLHNNSRKGNVKYKNSSNILILNNNQVVLNTNRNLDINIYRELYDTTYSVFNDKLIKFFEENIADNSKNFFIFHDVALGDQISAGGMIRFLYTKFDNIIIACQKIYHKQLQELYKDLPNIYFYVLDYENFIWDIHYHFSNILFNFETNESTCLDKVKKIISSKNISFKFNGNENNYIIDKNSYLFPDRMYKNYNIDIKIRYDYFKINRDIETENTVYNELIKILGNDYIIVIDDEKRNFTINLPNQKYPIFKLGLDSKNKNINLELIKNDNIINYIKILENAKEIHSIDSSLLLLIDQIDLKSRIFVYPSLRYNYVGKSMVIYKNKNFIFKK